MMENSEPKKVGPFHLTVNKHKTVRRAAKEPVYTVTLKQSAADPIVSVTIKSNSDNIYKQFPLNEEVEVIFTLPQTHLGT